LQNFYDADITDIYDYLYPTPQNELENLAGFLLSRSSGKSLCELGVGTGRLALPLADFGFNVTGIDTSPFMLERLKLKDTKKAVNVIAQDFIRDELPKNSYDAILLACNTIFVAQTLSQQQDIFSNAARGLSESGIFVIETFNPIRYIRDSQQQLEMRHLATNLILFEQIHIDIVQQTLHANNLILRDGKSTLQYTQKIRYMTPFEMDAVAKSTGLVLRERTNDWSGNAFNELASRIISVYERE